jgi:hypothetical protein
MSLLLSASKLYVPGFVRKRQLERLFKATAAAFGCATPSTAVLPFEETLKLYAQFTRQQAVQAIRQGQELETQARLFQNALDIGQQLKRDFRVSQPEVMRMAALVYRLLKIDFQGTDDGHIVIKRCFFSDYYTGEVCRLISSLDEGLLVGLAGGGRLSFSRRITEGAECCRAQLEKESPSMLKHRPK